VRIHQCEKKTLQIVIYLRAIACEQLPLHRSETTENVRIRLDDDSQNVCVTITSAVEFMCFETVAAAPRDGRETCFPFNSNDQNGMKQRQLSNGAG
jgi:hypothetical protein